MMFSSPDQVTEDGDGEKDQNHQRPTAGGTVKMLIIKKNYLYDIQFIRNNKHSVIFVRIKDKKRKSVHQEPGSD